MGEDGKAPLKIAAVRERSEELSMHCVTVRVYPLYYGLLLFLPFSSLELYSAEEIFCRMVPRYYLAIYLSLFFCLSLSLSLAFFFSLSLSLSLFSYPIYILFSFMYAPVVRLGIYVNAIPTSRARPQASTAHALVREHIRVVVIVIKSESSQGVAKQR